MPPKRGSSTPKAKRGGRGSRGTPRGKVNQSEAEEESKMVDDSMELGVKVEKPVEEEEKSGGKVNQSEAAEESKMVDDSKELGVKIEKPVEEEKPGEVSPKVVEEERRVEMSLRDVEEENVVEMSPKVKEEEGRVEMSLGDVEEERVVEKSTVKVEEEEMVVVQPNFGVDDESKIQMEINVETQSAIEVEPVTEKSFAKIVEEEVKESNQEDQEDEKDERLDLEDNDQEYEREEYCGTDYDEKEVELEEYHEQGDEQSGGIDEENAGEEEIDDMGEEDIEEVAEEEDGHDGGHEQIEGANVDDADHQEALKERRKRKEFEVFVGGLDKDATEEDLKKVFGKVGEVTEVRLMVNHQTKKNKGFAFLRFATSEQAKRAVTELKNPMVCGKLCGVSPNQDSDTLFLGNICKTWTKEALKEKLKAYGIENIDDMTLVEDGDNKGMNRGFAFLEFSSRSEAMEAFRRLQKRGVSFGIDKPAKVSLADSFIDPGDEIMAKVRTVFVDGLLPSWDEDQVRDLLQKYGKIEKIELARNMPSAKRKDFGFVTFDNHDIAVTCAKNINNTDLGNEDKARVRARLSRPLQKNWGRHIHHSDNSRQRPPIRGGRGPPSRPSLRSPPRRGLRRVISRDPPVPIRRSVEIRERRQDLAPPPRVRPVYSPPRSYDRRPPVPIYPKSVSARDYRRVEVPPRSRPAVDYDHRVTLDRRQSYRDEYSTRVSGYPDVSRAPPHSPVRRSYADDIYARRFERPHGYREGRPRDYDSVSGTKRPYSELDEPPPPQYADGSARHSRPRLNYEISASQFGDAYTERHGRNSVGYISSRSLSSGHDSRGLYNSRQGSYGSTDVGGVYSSSSYAGDYPSRRPDVTNRSYSSLYSTRGAGSSSYINNRSSGSYY